MQGTVTVVTLTGEAWIKDQNGQLHRLHEGDTINPGDTVVTASDAYLVLVDGQNVQYEVPEGSEVTLSAEHGNDSFASQQETEREADNGESEAGREDEQFEQLLRDSGNSPTSTSDGGHSANSIDEGNTFVRVDRIRLNLDPLEYDYEYGRSDELEWREGGALSLTDSGESGTFRQDEIVDDSDDQDTTSPQVSVELTGSGEDGTYSQDEIGDDGTVTAQVTLEDGTEVGDTLVVTDKDGNELLNRPV
ncbi:retention module-containing protein, partial [Halomonas organivorans]